MFCFIDSLFITVYNVKILSKLDGYYSKWKKFGRDKMSRVANDLCEAFPWCKIQYQMLEQLNKLVCDILLYICHNGSSISSHYLVLDMGCI